MNVNKLVDQFRSIDPSDPGRWPLAVRMALIGLLLVVATVLSIYFLAWSPQQPRLDAARAEEAKLMDTLKQKAGKAANLDAYKARLKEMEQSFGAMLRQLPNRTEIPSLLVDIAQTGLAAGLEEKLFQPGAQVNKDFYAEMPIKIRLTGAYHSIGAFVSGIAALPRIVTLHDLQISPVSARGASSGTDNLQLDVTAKTYRYLDDAELAARQAASKPKGRKK